MTDDQKAKVTNYDTLTAAEDSYKVAETKALINAIGDVEYTAESKAKIDAAQEAFDALTSDLQDRLNNTYVLVYAHQ